MDTPIQHDLCRICGLWGFGVHFRAPSCYHQSPEECVKGRICRIRAGPSSARFGVETRRLGLRHPVSHSALHRVYATMMYDDLITIDPQICGGQPVIKGTRVTLRTVLGSLAEGDTVEQILRSFPSLTEEAVRAVISFAAASAFDDLPFPGAKVQG